MCNFKIMFCSTGNTIHPIRDAKTVKKLFRSRRTEYLDLTVNAKKIVYFDETKLIEANWIPESHHEYEENNLFRSNRIGYLDLAGPTCRPKIPGPRRPRIPRLRQSPRRAQRKMKRHRRSGDREFESASENDEKLTRR